MAFYSISVMQKMNEIKLHLDVSYFLKFDKNLHFC